MEVIRTRALRGPNLWSHHTAMEVVVSCPPDQRAIAQLPGFEQRLQARFPEVGDLHATGDTISLANVLEAAALSLQAQAGCPVTFSRTSATPEEGVYQTVVEYSEEAVGRLAVTMAENLINAALNDTAFDLAAALTELRDLDEDVRLGPSTGSIVNAALTRDIPIRRLTEGSMVMFGWGSKQRRIQAAEMDTTSAIGESIAQDKELTKKLLHAAGVPVPYGRTVADEADAWKAAQDIGMPVVVKPKDGNQGKGVTVNVNSKEHLEQAFRTAKEFRDDVMVERYLPGHDFRLLVIGNKLIAAARRDPPQVVGDGVHTVRQLVDLVNSDPRRGSGHSTSLTKIRFDDIALARLALQDLEADSVPSKGQRVILRNNANLSTGGTATDVTDDVHPEVAARAVEAAQMIGLDICGVDVVCEGVLQPFDDRRGGVVEVNAAPGLRMHIAPSYGKGRAVGEAIVNTMFAPGENGRIPVVAVTGTNGKTTTTALVGHLLRALGHQAADVGNIGTPVSELALMKVPPAWAALELSSFQLHDTPGIMPDVGVLTTLSPDHLDRYASVAEYYADKKRLFSNAVEPSRWVTTADSADVDALVAGIPGHWSRFSVHRTDVDGYFNRASGMLHLFGEPLVARDRLALVGDHNVSNALAALLAVMAADPLHRIPSARSALATAIGTFAALPHRLEPVVDRDGLLWLNDSKATNIGSTKVALASMTRPTIVMLGGRHKGESYTALVPELLRTAKVVLAFGEAGALITGDLEAPLHGKVQVEHCGAESFAEVMQRARAWAVSGDAVLLSPACSSYDMFDNYEARGREFARLADALAGDPA